MSHKDKLETFVDEGYRVAVTGRHVLVTDAMKDYATEKISKLERFSPRLIDVNVTMDVQKLDHKVDIVMRYNNIKIVSHAVTYDMYASIDLAIDKLARQIRRYKNKIQDHHAKGVRSVDMNVQVVRPPTDEELNEVNQDIETANAQDMINQYRPHLVVAQDKLPLKTLNLNEAIMKMELSGNVFLIYRSEEDHKVKIIYRRSDNNYGVIEPEC